MKQSSNPVDCFSRQMEIVKQSSHSLGDLFSRWMEIVKQSSNPVDCFSRQMEIVKQSSHSLGDLFSRWMEIVKQSSNPVYYFIDEFEELQFGALSSFAPYFDAPDLSTHFLNIESNLTKACVHHIIK